MNTMTPLGRGRTWFQALADDAQPIERIGDSGRGELAESLDDGVNTHACVCPSIDS